jgi:hypothetical protein
MLIAPQKIPSKVFGIVLALLLAFFFAVSVKSAITTTFCNTDLCPLRFDFVAFLATFVLTGCIGLGVASLAYVISKAMVKARWPKTEF